MRSRCLSIFLTILMVFCASMSGYADPVADGICQVGDLLAPGESCTYPGTDTAFSVNNNGNGQFLFFSSGSRLNIRDTQINNVSYTLVAEKLDSGSWEIKALGATAAPPPTTNHAPIFTEGVSTTRSVPENTAAGQNIGNAVAATDADTADTLTYTLGGTDAASFDIDSTTGQLQTKATLDAATKSTYTVTITVSDGTDTDTITVTINITGTSIEPPPIADGICRVGAVLAAGESCTYPGTDTEFSVNSNGNGQFLFFSSGSRLNIRDTQINNVSYTLVAEKLDSGSWEIKALGATAAPPPTTNNVTDVTVEPPPTSNNAPIFADGASTPRTVADGICRVGDVLAAGQSCTYPGTDTEFSVNSTGNGQFLFFSSGSRLNIRDTQINNVSYTLIAEKLNSGSWEIKELGATAAPPPTTNNAPVFTDGTSTTRTIAKNTASGTNIGTAVAATDADNDSLTYTLGGTDMASFTIVSTSGQLQTRAALDYETQSFYSVSVSVSDGNGGTDSIAVTITVTGGETPPVADGICRVGAVLAAGESCTYPGTDTEFSVNSNGNGQFLFFSSGSRLNIRDTQINNVSYTLVAEKLNSGSWEIKALGATAAPAPPPNNVPVFTEGVFTTRSVAESTAAGQNIGSAVAATDADNNTLTYTLGGTDAASFSILSTSGQLQTSAALDYETKSSYSVSVSVSDGKGGSDSISVTINVTDVNEGVPNNAPVFTDGTSTTRSIAENTTSGTNIGTAIAATDADNDTLTYSLGGTDAASFRIISTSGQLRTNAALDYETKASYTVTVSVSDGNGESDSISVTINVTDVNERRRQPRQSLNSAPVFTESGRATRTVAENTPAGTNIGTPVAATDADGDVLTYSLGWIEGSPPFNIDSTNGQLQTKAPLDYETKNIYSFAVFADDGKASIAISVTINVTDVNEVPDVNENRAPVFADGSSTTRAIAENAPGDTNIGAAVAATDPDNDDLTYTLGGTDAAAFGIDTATGQLKTDAALDFETKTTYSVTITVSDGTLTDTITVTINVTDLDERPSNIAPVFTEGATATRTVAENTNSGVNIGTPVSATDGDSNTLTYLLSGADASSFRIVSNTGQLQTSAALDFETKSVYTVTLTVSDGSLTDEITVTINVTNVNEAPSFTDGASTTRSIAENTAAGANIGAVIAATDPDANTTLTYTLGGTDAASFGIVSTSGQLQTSAALDYETKNSYSVTVSVSDGNGGYDSITVTIHVTDVAEITPPLRDRTPQVRDGIVAAVPGVSNADDVTVAQLAAITELNLPSKSISFLKTGDFNGLTALSTLDLNSNSISNISTLENLTTLTKLRLGNNLISNISTLKNLTALTKLTLGRNRISDISALEGLTSLATLSLNNNWISNISTLKNLTALTYLTLNNNSISDISVLEHLTKLTYLTLYYNSISDISALEDLTALTELHLGWNSISDISALKNLTKLTELSLNNNSISDISALEKLTALTKLYLHDNSISDISVLEKLTKLTWLEMFSNSISDISALEKLTALTELYLNYNSISDISVLEKLTKLTWLELSGNSISDISALENLTKLTWLNLYLNSISDISALENLTALTDLYLNRNPISDYAPLRRLKAALAVTEGHQGLDLDITIPAVADNNDPVFSNGDSTTRSVAENTDSDTDIGAAVAATDADTGDTLTYHLGGTDAKSFSIVRTSGQLQTNAALDYETKSSYTVKVAVSDGKGGSDTITVTINVTDVVAAAPSVQTPPALPETTALLSNFPNPFNPETWIPYQLAEPSEVTLTIYDIRGRVVRTLRLGHQPAGFYQSRSKAAHWDGRNQLGEKVATGVYFYTLKAGDYIATRKLLIRK